MVLDTSTLLRDISGIIIGSISSILIVIMFIDFLRHEYQYKTYGFRFWRLQIHVIVSIMIFLPFTIFAIHTTIISIYSMISTINNSFYAPWCLSTMNEMWSFFIGNLFLYQFFIIRLHQVFTGSSFAVSSTKLKLISIMISVALISNSLINCIRSFKPMLLLSDSSVDWSHSDIHTFRDCKLLYAQFDSAVFKKLAYAAAGIYVIAELVYTVVILRLFLSRILLLSISYDTMTSKLEVSKSNGSKTDTNSTTNTDDSENQKKKRRHRRNKTEIANTELFLNLAIKTTNLLIMAVFSNFIVLFKFSMGLPASLTNIDVLFNCLSVYLSYKFSSKYYVKLFGSCHNRCYSCCITMCYCCCLPSYSSPQQTRKQTVESVSVKNGNENTMVVVQ